VVTLSRGRHQEIAFGGGGEGGGVRGMSTREYEVEGCRHREYARKSVAIEPRVLNFALPPTTTFLYQRVGGTYLSHEQLWKAYRIQQ
jgi:hypothetical protein